MKQLALAIALAAALAACGNKTETSSTTASTASPAPASPAPAANAPTMPSTAATPAPAPPTSPPAPVTPSTATSDSSGTGASTTAMGAASPGSGQDVYTKTCSVCHAAGVTGAPKPGDKADWGPRIAQGKDVLYEHALKGYTGKKGTMPPKGGNTALADADVKAAVDFMVSQAK